VVNTPVFLICVLLHAYIRIGVGWPLHRFISHACEAETPSFLPRWAIVQAMYTPITRIALVFMGV